MIRLSLALIGTAILASGCVQGDAPGAGTPATGSPKAQRLSDTARLAMPPKPAPVREADASPPAPVIAETLREDPDPEQRREAVYALADADAKDSAATLGEALYDPNWPLHAAAALGADPEFERWPVQYGWWLTRREGLLRKLGVRI